MFSTDGTLISASAAPHREVIIRELSCLHKRMIIKTLNKTNSALIYHWFVSKRKLVKYCSAKNQPGLVTFVQHAIPCNFSCGGLLYWLHISESFQFHSDIWTAMFYTWSWTGNRDSSLVQHRTHEWKVASSGPGRSSGRISSPELTFCGDSYLLSVPSCVTAVSAVACKRPWSFCQKCRWRVPLKHACTLDSMK